MSSLGRPAVKLYTKPEMDKRQSVLLPAIFGIKACSRILTVLTTFCHQLPTDLTKYQIKFHHTILHCQTSFDTIVEPGSRDNVNLLSPEQVFIHEIPFDVIEIGSDRMEEDLPPMQSEEALMIRTALPSPYKEWIDKSDALKLKLRNLLKQASAKDENFMDNLRKGLMLG